MTPEAGKSPDQLEGLKLQLQKSQDQLESLLTAFERLQASSDEAQKSLDAERRAHETTSVELQACRALLAQRNSSDGPNPDDAEKELMATRVELDVAHEVERTLTEHYAKSLRDNSILEQKVKELEAKMDSLQMDLSHERSKSHDSPEPEPVRVEPKLFDASVIFQSAMPQVPPGAGKDMMQFLLRENLGTPADEIDPPEETRSTRQASPPRTLERERFTPATRREVSPTVWGNSLQAPSRTVLRPEVRADGLSAGPAPVWKGPPPSPSTGANYRGPWLSMGAARGRSPSPVVRTRPGWAGAREQSPGPVVRGLTPGQQAFFGGGAEAFFGGGSLQPPLQAPRSVSPGPMLVRTRSGSAGRLPATPRMASGDMHPVPRPSPRQMPMYGRGVPAQNLPMMGAVFR